MLLDDPDDSQLEWNCVENVEITTNQNKRSKRLNTDNFATESPEMSNTNMLFDN